LDNQVIPELRKGNSSFVCSYAAGLLLLLLCRWGLAVLVIWDLWHWSSHTE